jgi:hypothetical protein
MEYVLVSTSVCLKNKVIRKEDKVTLTEKAFGKDNLEAAYRAGYIKPKGSEAKNTEEVLLEVAEADKKANNTAKMKKLADAKKAKAEAEAKAKEVKTKK